MMKKVLAVSIFAISMVTGANAVIVSQENIVGANGVSVNVPTTGDNKGKVVVSGPNLPTVNDATLTIQKNGTTVDTFTANASSNKTINITVPTSASDVSAVPTSRKVNGKALSSDVTLSGADVALTGYTKPGSTGAIAAADTVNAAIGKLEKALDGKQASGNYATAAQGTKADSAIQSVQVNGTALTADSNKAVNVTVPTKTSDLTNDSGFLTSHQSISGKMDKTVSGDKNGVIVRNSAGTAMKGTGTDITVSDAGAITVTHATSADSATSASSADAVAWGNVSGKPSTFAPSSHNQASNTINAMTGYSKPDSTGAIATDDTLNAAIGKLEKALDGKQASGSYVTTSRKVNGKALSSNVTLSGADVALTGYTKPDSTGAIAAADTVNAAIGKLEKALDGKQATMTVDTALSSTSTNPVQNKVVNSALAGKVATTVSGDKNGVIVRNSAGTAMKGTGTDITVSDAGAITVTHATSADSATTATNARNIPSGSANANSFASIWVQ